jgi:hypothetical protein
VVIPTQVAIIPTQVAIIPTQVGGHTHPGCDHTHPGCGGGGEGDLLLAKTRMDQFFAWTFQAFPELAQMKETDHA